MLDRMVAVLSADAGFGQAARQEGGKSELRRAVCRITSGRTCSSTFDGKCHRKHTAAGVKPEVRVKRCGKSAPPGQQCSGQGKPHTEQDQIGKEPGWSGERAARAGSHEPDARAKQAQAVAEPLKKSPVRAGSARQTSG